MKLGFYHSDFQAGASFLTEALAPRETVKLWDTSSPKTAGEVLGLAAHGAQHQILASHGPPLDVSDLTRNLKTQWVLLCSCNTLAQGSRVAPPPGVKNEKEYDYYRPWRPNARDADLVSEVSGDFIGVLFGMSTLGEFTVEKARLFNEHGKAPTATSLSDRWLVSLSAGHIPFVPICVATRSEEWLKQGEWGWSPGPGIPQNEDEVYLEYACWEVADAIVPLKLPDLIDEAKKKSGISSPHIGYLIVDKFLRSAPSTHAEPRIRWIVATNDHPQANPRVDFNGRVEVWMRPQADNKSVDVVEKFSINDIGGLNEERPAKWPPDQSDQELWTQMARTKLQPSSGNDWRLYSYSLGWRPVEAEKRLSPFAVLLFIRSWPLGSGGIGVEAHELQRVEIDLFNTNNIYLEKPPPGSSFEGRLQQFIKDLENINAKGP